MVSESSIQPLISSGSSMFLMSWHVNWSAYGVLLSGVIIAANLMGCDVLDLMLALSTCGILAGNDNTVQKLTSPQV